MTGLDIIAEGTKFSSFFSGYESPIKIISFRAPVTVAMPSPNKPIQTHGPAVATQATTKLSAKLRTHFLAGIPSPSLHVES